MEENIVLKERKDNIVKFLKTKFNFLSYFLLAIIVLIAVRIRTLNLSRLRDITTGGWTLGPDLDPFLFTRWAKYIVENGSLMAIDMMRYVPLGYNTKGELLLHPYLMAWFHKIAALFGSTSVEQSAAIYPVFMFALTVIVFFLLVKKIFINIIGNKKACIIALISSFFLTILPSLLPRTIAGIPEKESTGFLFLFLAFYVFLLAWNAKKLKTGIAISILAGAVTSMMVLCWGGSEYVYATITITVLISFLLGKITKDKFYRYLTWFVASIIFAYPFTTRFTLINILTSVTYATTLFTLLIILIHNILISTKLHKYLEVGFLSKVPKEIITFMLVILSSLIIITIVHPDFIIDRIKEILNILIQPITDRLNFTVAENRQPFYHEWAYSFGPVIFGLPIFFWLFFFGSIYLFSFITKTLNKKEKITIILSYFIFLLCTIFSRYSPNSIFNGTNILSLITYSLGFVIFFSSFGYIYYKYYSLKQEEKLRKIKFNLIFLFVFFFLSLVSVRGAVRLIMILVPSASVMVSFLTVALYENAMKTTEDKLKIFYWSLAIGVSILVVISGLKLYDTSAGTAGSYIPSSYNLQWQKAMSWVRENTPDDAVFAHWWDYGYWLQSIGNRATVLDGGNAVPYWDHLMGRHALTGYNDMDALEFLHTRNATHLLIDSTDIGKYGAFSSIGSDEKYDRRSWIPTLLKDKKQTHETRNSTIFVYSGGVMLDEDIIYNDGKEDILLPAGSAGIGAVTLEYDNSGNLIKQPFAVYIHQNKQYYFPLRYMYYNNELKDFGSGVEAGIFVVPTAELSSNTVDFNGAILYFSRRTVKTQFARLFLYKENNEFFKLVHSEDDFLVAQIKMQYPNLGDFVYYGEVRGPIRIWEINYPSGIKSKQEYLQTEYPNINLSRI